MESPKRLSNEDFAFIYGKVPRFNVDLVIRTSDNSIILVQRAIEPYLGFWHLPGGTLYKGETINQAAVRVAKNETGLDVEVIKSLGFTEFINEKRGDLLAHTICAVIEVRVIGGTLAKDGDAQNIGTFTTLPSPMVTEHQTFIEENNIL